MIYIYSHTSSSRLQYICKFIFNELLGINFKIIIDSETFKEYNGPKINYSIEKINCNSFVIQNHALLFQQNITNQNIKCFNEDNYLAFYKIENSNISFDIFAATFYLLSRYEEYLPHEKDIYGRYFHENSLAFKNKFLQQPIINIWVNDFATKLKMMFSSLHFIYPTFKYIPTYDIDMAFKYKHKGFIRNLGGFTKQPSINRLQVLSGFKKDPYDSFSFLNELHKKYQTNPIYFFLMAEKNSIYDKNILPFKNIMWKLIKQHVVKYKIGIHPSWQSGDNFNILKSEIKYLETISGNSITNSRQHYIRFNLPQGYQHLINVNITDDYSMGYGTINGFRASVASSFNWYNLQTEEETNLRIHPFCFMEANSFYEEHKNSDQAYLDMQYYYNLCKKVNGIFISIWHNNFLGTSKEFLNWRNLYNTFYKNNL